MSHHSLHILNGLHGFLKMQLFRSCKPEIPIISRIFERKSSFKAYFHHLGLAILGSTIEKILNHISAKGEMDEAWQWWIELAYLDDRVLFEAEIEPIIAAPKPANNKCFPAETPFKKSLTYKFIYLQAIHYRVKNNLLVFSTLWEW